MLDQHREHTRYWRGLQCRKAGTVELQPGTLLGRYRIENRLGSGGMGTVYRARDERLDVAVAVKVMQDFAAADPVARARFDVEARTLARLRPHPHIVQVLDWGPDDEVGAPWIVMTLVEGNDLAAVLRSSSGYPLPVKRAMDIATQVGGALDYVHGMELVHRDVKPANILLSRVEHEREFALLSDFGIVKDLARAELLTRAPVGTWEYAAPELLEINKADHRADVYALGAVLFEMLSGQRPFPATTLSALLAAKIARSVPDARSVCPELPVDAAEALARALHPDPDRRPGTCAELVEEVRAALTPTLADPATLASRPGPPLQPRVRQIPIDEPAGEPVVEVEVRAPRALAGRVRVVVTLFSVLVVALLGTGVVLHTGKRGDLATGGAVPPVVGQSTYGAPADTVPAPIPGTAPAGPLHATASILAPSSVKAGAPVTLRGTVTGLAGHGLWVVADPHSRPLYEPQPGPVTFQEGAWTIRDDVIATASRRTDQPIHSVTYRLYADAAGACLTSLVSIGDGSQPSTVDTSCGAPLADVTVPIR